MTSETPRLRVSVPARWTSSRGGCTGIPSGMTECGRGDSFGRCRSHRDDERPSLRGSQRSPSQGARQGRNTLPSLDVRVEGRRSGSGRQARCPARLGSAKRAAASERVRFKAQGSIERARSGNVARNATDSSVEQSLEVDEQSSAPWRHGSGHGSNGEKAHQSVNAIASERTRRGDGMVESCRGGERFVGYSPQGTTPPDLRVHDLRVGLFREGEQGVRNVVNPMAGCGVQQTRRPSNESVFGSARLRRKPLKPGGTAGTEHARDLAVPSRSPGDGLDGKWTQ